MPTLTEEVKSDLLNMPSSLFASKWILDRIPFIFEGNYTAYTKWRHQLAEPLKIDANDIIFTGSSCIGVSLNPNHMFRPFNNKSDVDIGIISDHYFETAWYELRHLNFNTATLTPKMITAVKEHRERFIYWGTIATDKILPLLSFGLEWNSIVNKLHEVEAFFGRDINFRIYKDNKSFRDYQNISIEKCRDSILEVVE